MRLTLILGDSEAELLDRVAAREDRAPRHQAHRLLREALMRESAPPAELRESAPVPATSERAS